MDSTTLPLDLIEAIVDDLASQGDTTALKACALACRLMYFCSRKHIFFSIHMGVNPSASGRHGGKPRIKQLVSLLNHSPDIPDYIKEFSYTLWRGDYKDQSAPIVLKRLTQVRSLTLDGLAQFRPWNRVPIRFQEAMIHLIQLPSLTKLDLVSCRNIPIALFASCPNLTQLKMQDVELQDTDDLAGLVPSQLLDNPPHLEKFIFSYGSPACLEKLLQSRRPDRLPFFNFSHLVHLSLLHRGDIEKSTAETISEQATRLASLTCKVPDTGLSHVLHSHCLSTSLTCLKVKLILDDESYGLLHGLCRELKKLAGMNVLEKLKLGLGIARYTVGEEWRELDEVLATSGFPRLRLVIITVKMIGISGRSQEELLEIPQRYLPLLNTNPTVALVFSLPKEEWWED